MTAIPAWERLRAPAGAGLNVRPPEERAFEVLELQDGDLPEVDGATAFLVQRRAGGGFEVWAARIGEHGDAATYVVQCHRLHVRATDDALARMLDFDPGDPPPDVTWSWLARAEPAAVGTTLVCACRGITRGEIEAAVARGWRTVDAVKRATKATFGECQSRGCAAEIARIIGLAEGDPRSQITPRPPLVPVPASILAVFVPQPGEAARPSPLSSPSVSGL